MNFTGGQHFSLSRSLITARSRDYIVHAIVFLLAFLFGYAALTKLMTLDQFRVQIGQSPLLTRWSDELSWIIPIIELAVVAGLCFVKTRKAGLFGSFGLMVMFTTYIIMVMHFSPFVPCSCGGVLEDMTWGQHLVFNIFFIVLTLVGIYMTSIDEGSS